jgi:hypothetical protein
MESHPQNDNPLNAETSETTGNQLCKECARPVSQKTGECYYCKKGDVNMEKDLGMIMLDWQQQAASDPDARQKEKSKKGISLLLAILASACIASGIVPDFIPHFPAYYFLLCGVAIAFCCWSFYFNSMTLLLTIITTMAVLLLYANVILKSIPHQLMAAIASAFVIGISTLIIFLISLRIFKNKAIEL